MAKVHRAFVYRIYPSPEQEQRLLRWEGTLRFLWNLAHEQRLLGLARSRSERVYPSWYDQKKEVTAFREELEWLQDVPRVAIDQMLKSLDDAWQRCFKRKGGKPKFKSRSKDTMSIRSDSPDAFSVTGEGNKATLRYAKIGEMPIVLHRPLEGKPKRATIRRDVDQWFVSIMCEVNDHLPMKADIMSVVGIDRGVTNAIADSKGILVPRPSFLDEGQRKIEKLQREMSRKLKGSNRRAKARVKLARAHRKLRRQREHFLNVEAYRYVKNHDVVVVEDLNIASMTKSAKGTVEEPGKNVRQKSGLNRSILSIGWGQFVQLLDQKAARYGVTVVKVPAAYSSQTCAKCGHIDEASRKGPMFRCTQCDHQDHADVNAAKVLVQRYEEGRRAAGLKSAEATRKQPKKRKVAKTKSREAPATAAELQPASQGQATLLSILASYLPPHRASSLKT